MKLLSPTMGIFGPCRLSYLHVLKPRKNDMRGEDEYGCTLLIPKQPNQFCSDPKAIVDMIVTLIKNAAAEKFGAEWRQFDKPLKDGDLETNGEGEPKYPGYRFLNVRASIDYPPVLIDGKRKPVTGGWESGDWGVAKVSFFAYDFKGKKGVSAGLRALQFLYVDDHFGTSTDPIAVANEFDEVADAQAGTSAMQTDDESDPFADD